MLWKLSPREGSLPSRLLPIALPVTAFQPEVGMTALHTEMEFLTPFEMKRLLYWDLGPL